MSDPWKMENVPPGVAARSVLDPSVFRDGSEHLAALQDRVVLLESRIRAAPHTITCRAFKSNREPLQQMVDRGVAVTIRLGLNEQPDDVHCDCWKRAALP